MVARGAGGGEGYSWKFLVGVCRLVLQIPTWFQTKKCNFPHPFSDYTSKIHTRFRTPGRPGLYAESMLSLFWLERKEKKLFKSIPNSHIYFSFFLTYLELKRYWYVHTLRSSLENHTRFQAKLGKEYTRFQTKTTQKPYPMGRHIPI